MSDVPRDAKMIMALLEDARWAETAARASGQKYPQSARRAYVRAHFALIEGGLAVYGQSILRKHKDKLTKKQIEALSDGKPYATLEKRWKTTYDVLRRINDGFAIPPPNYGMDWDNFERAIAIRHRLTHPKAAEGLDVSDEEITVVADAFKYAAKIVGEGFRRWMEDHKDDLSTALAPLVELITDIVTSLPPLPPKNP